MRLSRIDLPPEEMPMNIEDADHSLGEIEQQLSYLRRHLSQLEDNIHRLIERTAPIAAMDRAIPETGENPTDPDSVETMLGHILVDIRNHVRYLNDKVNEHNYRVELP